MYWLNTQSISSADTRSYKMDWLFTLNQSERENLPQETHPKAMSFSRSLSVKSPLDYYLLYNLQISPDFDWGYTTS